MNEKLASEIKILAVEDDPADYSLIRAYLRLAGYGLDVDHDTVSWATTLAEATTQAAQSKPDIILLDMSLPDSTGLATVISMRNVLPSVPIIVLSGNADKGVAIASLKAGAQDYLVKGHYEHDALGKALSHSLIRANLEAQVVESEFRWKFAIEGSGDGLWDWDFTAGTILFSKRWYEIQGFDESEVGPGVKDWEDLVHPDDLPTVNAALQKHFYGETPSFSCEHRVRHKSGDYKWILGRGMVVARDVNAKPLRIIGTHSDITERKNVELALRLKDFALNAAANAVVITDTEGRIEWANKAFSQLSGYELNESTGKLLGELVKSGLQDEAFYKQLWQTIQKREVWKGELLNRRKDRSLYWEEMSIAPMVSDNGEITHFVAIKQDISQRKTAEQDLLDAQEEMRGLLNTMAEGAFAIDVLGRCIFVNRAFMETLGYSDSSELIGKDIHELIHSKHADGRLYPIEECQMRRVSKTRQPVNVSNEVFWRKDGTSIPVEYWARPMVKDGLVTGVVLTFIDITQRVMIQQEQGKMSGMLLRQNRQLKEYSDHIKEEEATARDFIKQFSALDKIHDPLVQFMLKPATNFSGDMIAFARTPDNRLHVLLADSAGHGLTAALAVIPITQPFYQMTSKGFDIAAIAQEMNRRVRDYLPLPRYVACVLISLDTESQTIQVWNGGCPEVLMLDLDGNAILHRFKSKFLPMGVVKPERFNATVEHLNYEGKQCQLFTCSDGATEMMALRSGADGYEELLTKSQQFKATNLFESLTSVIELETSEIEQKDDIAMLLVQCAAENEGSTTDNQIARLAESNLPQDLVLSGLAQANEPIWRYQMTLTAPQLKQLDVVPFLMSITSQIEGKKTETTLFLVLSELFNNALDHGVLKLDSALKHKTEDMEAYYEEREKRLANLEQGKIEVHLEKFQTQTGCLMKIHVQDSGEGFDFNTLHQAIGTGGKRIRHGRGIPLIESSCNSLQYLGNGSEVIAHLELSQS